MWENTSIAHVLEHTQVQKCLLLSFSCHCKGTVYATLHQAFNSWCGLVTFYCFLSFFTLNYGSLLLGCHKNQVDLWWWDKQDCPSGKLACPTRSPCELTEFPDVLKLVFLLLFEMPPDCVQSLSILVIQIWKEKCAQGLGDVCRRKRSEGKEAACFV